MRVGSGGGEREEVVVVVVAARRVAEDVVDVEDERARVYILTVAMPRNKVQPTETRQDATRFGHVYAFEI